MPSTFAVPHLAPGVTREYLLRHRVCPIRTPRGGGLALAVTSDHAAHAITELVAAYGDVLDMTSVGDAELDQLVERLVTEDARTRDPGRDAVDDGDLGLEDVRELANQPPVVRYVNLLVREAHDAHASDIHLEATRQGVVARFRLDGVLHPAPDPPRALERAVVSRLKAMAELDVTERRSPQDGRIRVRLEDRELDLRISTVPTVHGESVVLRLLDRGGRPVALDELGMGSAVLAMVQSAIERPHGMLLVTGPTGSGKTTTLYAALQCRSAQREKIVTVEEPVEYQLDGVTQVPVHRQTNVTFASALRAILRQDPDVVMIGETRDAETAGIAVQAAMTGHLVLSTLHTNDALGAIPRLIDLDVPAYLVAATVELIVAQRLVRRLCTTCAVRASADPTRIGLLDRDADANMPVWCSVGCDACRGTGFRGRTGVFEALRITDEIRRVIVRGGDQVALREASTPDAYAPLTSHALALVREGVTTLEEALRAVRA